MILCCGEALIDMLPRHSLTGELVFAPYTGGTICNSAITLGRLCVPVEFFSSISSDLFGQQIREILAASNAGSRYANMSARPMKLTFVRLDNGHATYTFYDENTDGQMLAEADLPVLGDDIDAILFGAISLIPEPCGSAYKALIRREHESRMTMLGPNIRPGFIQDKQAHLERMRRMLAMADIVKLSDEDLAWFGEKESHDGIAANWRHNGPKLIIVTNRRRGVTAYSDKHIVSVTSEKVHVVDTVGTGDTLNAGVLASLHEQNVLTKSAVAKLSETAIEQALLHGARAGAV